MESQRLTAHLPSPPQKKTKQVGIVKELKEARLASRSLFILNENKEFQEVSPPKAQKDN